MSAKKQARPSFQAVELDPMDLRLEAKAAEKGIPTLVTPESQFGLSSASSPKSALSKPGRAGGSSQSTPRARMKPLNIEVPDYAWIAIKTQAAQKMVSVRHIIMSALRASGIEIKAMTVPSRRRRAANKPCANIAWNCSVASRS
jgi:hypothetical protein